MPAKKKCRLDDLLVARGWAESKSQAQARILAGQVRTGTTILDKPGKSVAEDIDVTLVETYPYVSRGAEKLKGWFEAHPSDVTGWQVLDIGASTGGFTDYLLQNGAASATCVDVGRGQLHGKLRDDPRVTCLEQTNARNLAPGDLPRTSYDLLVMDVSFISVTKVLPAVWPFLRAGGLGVILVKPQFEASKADADKGRGVIRDDALREQLVEGVRAFCVDNLPGATIVATVDSPIAGPEGNREFLLGLRKA